MKTEFTPEQLADSTTAESAAAIRKCVHCGFCTATCPTYVLLGDELDSPRGRIYLMKDMLENERTPSAEVVKHVDRCLSCLSCRTTCPSGVDYMRLVDHARAYIEDRYERPWAERFYRGLLAAVLPYRRRFALALWGATIAKPLAPLIRGIAGLKPLAAMLDLAPKAPPRAPSRVTRRAAAQRKRIVLLRGCAEPVLQPQIREATMRVLDRAGFDVINVPGEGCCGALVQHMGRHEQALAFARRNIDAWTRAEADGPIDAIAITASGCGTTLKDYGFMLREDPIYADKAARLAGLARDISEILLDAPMAPPASPRGLRVAYHSACSLQHGQGIKDAPKRLLTAAGYEVCDVPEAHLCCGSAGVYNILQSDIATRLRDRKVENIEKTKPDIIAAGNIGCITQIAAGSHIPIVHTIELLDWAAGGPTPEGLAKFN